jgi:hypothetical protein
VLNWKIIFLKEVPYYSSHNLLLEASRQAEPEECRKRRMTKLQAAIELTAADKKHMVRRKEQPGMTRAESGAGLGRTGA